MRSWKCAVCLHANLDTTFCRSCGSHERLAMYPVEMPNAQQNTPDADALALRIETDEANRETDEPYADQLARLVSSVKAEKEHWTEEMRWGFDDQ